MKIITLPGLIDPHVHLRTPGQAHKEDFYTGTKAALAGGFTIVLDMPNNAIPIKTRKLLKGKINLAKQQAVADIGFYLGSQGDNLTEFEKVKGSVCGIKLYLNETTGNFLINPETLEQIFNAWPNDAGPILVHAEDDAVGEVIKNVEKTKKHAHFCHISLQTDLEQIINAKEKGLPVSCGVTPHHLFLTQTDADKLGPYGRMKPFLKSKKDVMFLWDHLDAIDVVESDHAPHTKEEKDSDNPPFGVPGLETTLPLLLTAVHEGRLQIKDIKRLCHDNAMKIFNLPNQDSSIEVDLDEEYTVNNEDLFTKCAWSPFAGRKMHGRLKKVTIREAVVFEKEKILAKPGSGRVIKPNV